MPARYFLTFILFAMTVVFSVDVDAKCKVKEIEDDVFRSKYFQTAKGWNDHARFRYYKVEGAIQLESLLFLSLKWGGKKARLTPETPMIFKSGTNQLELYPVEQVESHRHIIGLAWGNKSTLAYYDISAEAVEWILSHPVSEVTIEYLYGDSRESKTYSPKPKQQKLLTSFTECIRDAA